MSFFEAPEPRASEPEPEFQAPEWLAPPRNELGASVPLGIVAARSEQAVVWLPSAVAYSTGVEFSVDVHWRAEMADTARSCIYADGVSESGELKPELFRAGFELADGARVAWLGHAGAGLLHPNEQPDGPVLVPRGGSGGTLSWRQELWLWPLPPEGEFSFACEWPALGIDFTRVELDAGQLRDSARESGQLWRAP